MESEEADDSLRIDPRVVGSDWFVMKVQVKGMAHHRTSSTVDGG
jgi:hypothetical protein